MLGPFAEDDVVDFGGVDVAARVALVVVGGIGEGGLRDVKAGSGVVRALEDGEIGVVVVGEVANDFAVAAAAVVGIAEVVEGVRTARAVGVGGSVDIDVHAMGEDLKVLRGVLLGRRGMGLGGDEGGG